MFLQLYRSGRLSQYLLWLASAAGVVGLLGSRAIVALSPAVGMLAVLTNPNLKHDIRHYWRNGAALRAAAMYAFFLLSAFYTSEWGEWRHQLYRLLPWLGVPLAFAAAVPLSKSQRLTVGSLYVLGTAAIGLATLVKFWFDPVAAEDISIGHNVPSITHIFHIHFGVMLGLAFFFALSLRRSALAPSWLRWALLAAAIAITLTLHGLAYRTGLLVFYVVLLIDALRLLFRRRVVLGLGLLLALLVGPWVAYNTIAPIRQRLGATRWDIEQYTQHHDINNYSLARRLAAWETALLIFREHPVLGVAPADAQAAMMRQYEWRPMGLRPENRVMVHNQYLHQLMSSGMVGFTLWLLVLAVPLVQPKQRRNPYIWHFLLVSATANLVDSLLEMQIGFNLFVFGYGFIVVAGERHNREATPPIPLPS
ncbi:O-antigen ligase family protein [Hymenobacter sp. ASUV-10]|uniref:O-antigen ligase family protein n=1 Tax=Hymenobacter aranciens TaxID=3063996 RepID=A0ABT9BAN1_9BACT|nr:O-antigen ligase family protein [Hymenobacter sp. ASUV-10]MDO7875330.1 O-antigen ligase family protein [Hymenobacter sp. ASUV-10]